MAEETVDSLKKKMSQQQAVIESLQKQLLRKERAMNVLIAAGYLEGDKYDKAEALVNDFDDAA